MFSNLLKIIVFKSDEDKCPHMLLINCLVHTVPVQVTLEKNSEDGEWIVRFVDHREERCRYCGSVKLYSTCDELEQLLTEYFKAFLEWISKEKKNLECEKGELSDQYILIN